MAEDLATLARAISEALGQSLEGDGRRIAALAATEGEALAGALVRVGGLMLRGEVSRDEADILLRIQRDASEAVLASLAEVSRLAANRAVRRAIDDALATFSGTGGAVGLAGLARTLAG